MAPVAHVHNHSGGSVQEGLVHGSMGNAGCPVVSLLPLSLLTIADKGCGPSQLQRCPQRATYGATAQIKHQYPPPPFLFATETNVTPGLGRLLGLLLALGLALAIK
jgi:hypothetical protein